MASIARGMAAGPTVATREPQGFFSFIYESQIMLLDESYLWKGNASSLFYVYSSSYAIIKKCGHLFLIL